jgi:hypothetical protein
MCDETSLTEVVVPQVVRGAAEAGREAPPVIAGVLICVSDEPERTRRELGPRLAPLGGYKSYQAVLSHGSVPSRTPADVAAIGTEGEITGILERLMVLGAAECVAVVLPDPTDPAGSVGRAPSVSVSVWTRSPVSSPVMTPRPASSPWPSAGWQRSTCR